MTYVELALPRVGTLWYSQRDDTEAQAIPADGCIDIILQNGELIVAGPSTRWLSAEGGTGEATVGLRFKPGLARAVLGVVPEQVRDRVIPARDALEESMRRHGKSALQAVLDTGLARIAEAAHGVPGVPRRPEREVIETLRQLAPHPEHAELGWIAAVRTAAARGESLADLALSLGYSERQLRRRMLQTFGYGYAALRRIARTERARTAIRSGHELATAAQLSGYSDQAHMTREFGRVVGTTPARFAGSSGSPL